MSGPVTGSIHLDALQRGIRERSAKPGRDINEMRADQIRAEICRILNGSESKAEFRVRLENELGIHEAEITWETPGCEEWQRTYQLALSMGGLMVSATGAKVTVKFSMNVTVT